MGRGRNEGIDEWPFLQPGKPGGQTWWLPVGCGCVFFSACFSVFFGVNHFAGVRWERSIFSLPKKGRGYIKPLFSSSVYIYQHSQWLHLIEKGWRGDICSQFIKLTKDKNSSQLICQQQWNNSFSLGKENANNNSRDSGNRVVLEKGDFQLLARSSPFPKDILPNDRGKWFILAHVSRRGSQDHTVWSVGQACLPGSIITEEVLFC